jgi:hypothetical protein
VSDEHDQGDEGPEIRPDKFTADAEDLVVSQCAVCRHRGTRGNFPVCKAFPGQIPPEFLLNEADHRKPYEGDDGVRFEPRQGVSALVLANVYAALDRLES